MQNYEGKIYSGHVFKGVDKLTGNDDLKPVFKQAIIENGNIVATDSHHLVKIPLSFFGLESAEIEKLEGKSVSRETLQKLGVLKNSTSWGVTDQGFVIFKSGTLKPALIYPLESKDSEGKYPNYEAVLSEKKKKIDKVDSFYFKPQLLLNIERIFQNYNSDTKDSVFLECYGPNRSFLFKSKKTDFLGLITPVKI